MDDVDPANRIYEDDGRGYSVLVRSIESRKPVFIKFTNKTDRPVDVWWRDYQGDRRFYTRILPGRFFNVNTYITHPWEFTDAVTKESYMIENKIIFRAPLSTSRMELRSNWNITSPMRSLRAMALRKLGSSIHDPDAALELGLPRTLANELRNMIALLQAKYYPVQ